MNPEWRRFASLGLYLALISLLVAGTLYFIQRELNLYLQISLGLAVIGLALFAVLDPGRVRSAFTGRQARYGSNALVLTLAFLGILVVVNYLVYQNPKRWDLTENQRFTLTKDTEEVLAALPGPVEAVGFYTANMSSAQAETLLQEYKQRSDGKFDYRFVDPTEENLLAEEMGIDRDGSIVLRMGESKEIIAIPTEREITSAMVRLMSPGQTIYFLTGHGEFSPEDSGEQSLSQARATLEDKKYTVKMLNLLAEGQIPEDAAAIIVAGPTQPVSSGEVDQLKQFVANGGSLVVMQDPVVQTDFGDAPDPLGAYLLETWGIQLGNDVILDIVGNQNFGQPYVAVAAAYGAHPVTSDIETERLATLFPLSRSVNLDAERAEALGLVELVSTSDQSWAEMDLESLTNAEQGGAGPEPNDGIDRLGPVPLAAAGEDAASGGRIVVYGDSDFAADAFFGQYGNGDLFVNTIDWATEQEALINLTPKDETPRFMRPLQNITMNLILFGSVIALPGAVLVMGVLVWIRRRRVG